MVFVLSFHVVESVCVYGIEKRIIVLKEANKLSAELLLCWLTLEIRVNSVYARPLRLRLFLLVKAYFYEVILGDW